MVVSDTSTDQVDVQVALDTEDLALAVRIAESVGDIARIEAGTPLLHRHGLAALRALTSSLPGSVVVADWKTMDCGAKDAEMTLETGAQGMIVQAAAPIETILAAASVMNAAGCFIMVDLLGCDDIAESIQKLAEVPFESLVVHAGSDEQARGVSPLNRLRRVSLAADHLRLAVAGGLAPVDIPPLLQVDSLKVVIVGASVYSDKTPRAIVHQIRRCFTSGHTKGDPSAC